jgi:PAS domain S-box-containing protein
MKTTKFVNSRNLNQTCAGRLRNCTPAEAKTDLTLADKDSLLQAGSTRSNWRCNEELRRAQQEQESRDRYTDLFDYAPVGYFVLEKHFLIVDANLTGAMMLGQERGKLPGQRFARFIEKPDQSIFRRCLQAPKTAAEESCEIKMSDNSGKIFYVQMKSAEVSSGQDIRYRVTATDITQRKLAEEAVRSLNEALTRSHRTGTGE